MKQAQSILRSAITRGTNVFSKLAVPTLDALSFYDINDIVYLEAQSNYTAIHFIDKTKIIASKTLKDFESLLPESIFFRAHHSYLINLNCIRRYIKCNGGQIELQTGACVDVSRRKKEDFFKVIGY